MKAPNSSKEFPEYGGSKESREEKALRYLIMIFMVFIVVQGLSTVYLLWLLATNPMGDLSLVTGGLAVVTLALYYLCRRLLVARSSRAFWVYLATFVLNVGFSFYVTNYVTGSGFQISSLFSLIVPIGILATIYYLTQKGTLTGEDRL